jgi:hypothetical protein
MPGFALATVVAPRAAGEAGRDTSVLAARAERLAAQIDRACVETEDVLLASLAARDDQQMAWLVLCDRGWCPNHRRAPTDMWLVRGWLDVWSDFVALPLRVMRPTDRLRRRRCRRQLTRLERDLRAAIPASVWDIADPLDDTGRATLACALLALETWVEMTARADAIEAAKARQLAFLTLLAELSSSLGLPSPEARFDLAEWHKVAEAARALVAGRRETAA